MKLCTNVMLVKKCTLRMGHVYGNSLFLGELFVCLYVNVWRVSMTKIGEDSLAISLLGLVMIGGDVAADDTQVVMAENC